MTTDHEELITKTVEKLADLTEKREGVYVIWNDNEDEAAKQIVREALSQAHSDWQRELKNSEPHIIGTSYSDYSRGEVREYEVEYKGYTMRMSPRQFIELLNQVETLSQESENKKPMYCICDYPAKYSHWSKHWVDCPVRKNGGKPQEGEK